MSLMKLRIVITSRLTQLMLFVPLVINTDYAIMLTRRHLILCFFICTFLLSSIFVFAKKSDKIDKPSWAKKDIRDYNDADLERLYDQWEEDEEPLEEDELPEHLRPSPKIDLSNLDTTNPENLLKMSKKGRTLMMFVSVSGNPSKDELEEITKLWQSSLMNNHISAERFLVDDHRAIFMFKDGSQAWDAKDYLINQERLEEVTIENKPYYGKYSQKAKEEANNKSSDSLKIPKGAKSQEKTSSNGIPAGKRKSDEL